DLSQNTCFKNSWYTFTKWGRAEWDNSEICRDQGGDLASIETEEEWKFINQEIKKRSTWNVSAWHIGLEKGTDGSWTWKSGTQLNISKWRNCEISGNGKFAEVSKNGSLKAIRETNSKAFMCEIPEVCPNTSFKDSWYTFTNRGKTWNKNREICQSQGGDLVSIETEEEWNYITKEIQKHNISCYHIGLEKRDNNWTWLNGRPFLF
ncbi:macrophage mannose receptor 1-like, partial [Stylophora pistillata]|uniref:macrophage mannose receptor 1-like n=1 Tax=Stylophora pistillata TaxID=50429 RepID=UPI000C04D173